MGTARAAAVGWEAAGGAGGGAIAGAAGIALDGALAAAVILLEGCEVMGDGATGGGALAVCGIAGTDGAFGAIGGFAAIFGGAGGVARGAIGLRTDRGCDALAGAGRAAVARFILEGGFNWNPFETGAMPARGAAGVAGAKREPPRFAFGRPVVPAFGISRERIPGLRSCGTF